MERSFRNILILLAGIGLLAAAGSIHAILLETTRWSIVLAVLGALFTLWGLYALRGELGSLLRQRRGEIALYTAGVVGVLIALGYLSARFPLRVDMTQARLYSLSQPTIEMLKRLDKPVHITFFHDPMMRETVELYEQFAKQTDKITVEFYDPMLNPAQARMKGVEFAGTAIMESEGRKLQVNGPGETDIANGILRIAQGAQQVVCFLDGHGEPDPFSLESHDHMEGAGGHSHGLGAKLVLHERHGMAKARHGLETMNYLVQKISLSQGDHQLAKCNVLVVAGPRTGLLAPEIKAIDDYLENGGNGMFMLDPWITTGLEPIVREFGIVVDDTIVIDPASHFWTDVSAPAVTDYNRHEITRDLPLTFFPGARSLSPTEQRVAGSAVRPLVNTSKQSYAGTNPEKAEFVEGRDHSGPVTLLAFAERRPEFVSSSEAVMRELRGEKTKAGEPNPNSKIKTRSRLVIVGDSDFATNSFFHIMGNGKLFLNAVNYLAAQKNLMGITPRTYDEPRVNLTNRQMKGTFFLSLVLIPALMALVGIAVWWRQR